MEKLVAMILDRLILAIIAGGICYLLYTIIDKSTDGWDVAAFLLVLQAVITAVRGGQHQASTDKTMEKLGESQPIVHQLPSPDAFAEPKDPKAPIDPPEDIIDAADQVADAADTARNKIIGKE